MAYAARSEQLQSDIAAEEAREIALDAYTYAYPLVLMELTRRIGTNVPAPVPGKAPMNQFNHMPAFPDATFTDVVRPNADTLYSILWFDVSKEPLVISVPESGGRYYLLEMLDMWTDVFASPGSRTTGNSTQFFAITGPDFREPLRRGLTEIRSPTSVGWIIGRTQTNGVADYDNVHRFQARILATALSEWGKDYRPHKGTIHPEWDIRTPPVERVAKMSADEFFSLFAEITRHNPPHPNDYPILHRMGRIGLEPGRSFALAALTPDIRAALDEAGAPARKRIAATGLKSGAPVNGWRTNLTGIGTYGADYLHRAAVAYFGLGANSVEDAVYPSAFTDGDGNPMSSDDKYVLHFENGQLPPVRAFWSLTMYNERQAFAANPINRYAIGDRDDLRFNADGSLDLYIQRESPGADKESNWLPAPASGPFTMNMRLYWPMASVLDGVWSPPPVRRIE